MPFTPHFVFCAEPQPTSHGAINTLIRTPRFKQHLNVANKLATADYVEPYAARVVWIALVYGTAVAHRYACKSRVCKAAGAWDKLMKAGLIDLSNNCLSGDDNGDPIAWLFRLMRLASA